MPSTPLRLQSNGTAIITTITTITIYTVPTGQNLYLSSINVAMLAALATGNTCRLNLDGNTIAMLTPIQGALSLAYGDRPLIAGTSVTLVASATGIGTVEWSLQGDVI